MKSIRTDATVALVGNPNVGKSTIFNALTGMRQHTGNWPGKTVAFAEGVCTWKKYRWNLVDLPGCYSIFTRSAEEDVTRDFLLSGQVDLVVLVCDAGGLERNLNLVLQVLEMGLPAVLCLNMMDEAKSRGVSIDEEELSRRLHTPVVAASAGTGMGIDMLEEKISEILEAQRKEGNEDTKQPLRGKEAVPEIGSLRCSTEKRIQHAEAICRDVVRMERGSVDQRDRKLDRIFSGKYTAFPVLFLMLALIFWITLQGANIPSQLLSRGFVLLEEHGRDFAEHVGVSPLVQSFLFDGVYRVMAWVIAVMFPPMAIFFPLFTILEDFGYLPRVAFNLDRCFHRCHACGKQALTTCMGFGCNAVGVTGCRIIDSQRERMVAMLTNSFIPCNGRFPALLSLILLLFYMNGGTRIGVQSIPAVLVLSAFISASVFFSMVASWILSRTLLPGATSSFALELPPYRKPAVGKILIRSLLDRTIFVLGRAVLVAAPAGAVIWVLANYAPGGESLLHSFTDALDPLGRFLGMDGVILGAFLLGLPANEIVLPIMIMAYSSQNMLVEVGIGTMENVFFDHGWNAITIVCTMIFFLMHWPCATTLLTIRKESGSWYWAAAAFALPAIFGMCFCVAVRVLGSCFFM